MLLDGCNAVYSLEGMRPALEDASRSGHEEVAKLLFDRGVKVTIDSGYTGMALQLASERGSVNLVRLLLDKGADVNSQRGYCVTALQEAALHNQREVAQVLLDNDAQIDLFDTRYEDYKGSPLQLALERGNKDIALLLLKKGANPGLVKSTEAISFLKELQKGQCTHSKDA